MAQDETDVAARLAEVLTQAGCPWPSSRLLAAALLPVVRELGDLRAAEALDETSAEMDDWAANAHRYQATVSADSIEHAAATARMLAYERAANVAKRRAATLRGEAGR